MAAGPEARPALIVEDERAIRELLRLHLTSAGFAVERPPTGDGAAALAEHAFDLILLDVMLPGLDGMTSAARSAPSGPNAATPILMVTARDTEADTVLGLESGADDYLTKPFGVRELMARVTALTAPSRTGRGRGRRRAASLTRRRARASIAAGAPCCARRAGRADQAGVRPAVPARRTSRASSSAARRCSSSVARTTPTSPSARSTR